MLDSIFPFEVGVQAVSRNTAGEEPSASKVRSGSRRVDQPDFTSADA
jgi:hypothetical protein